MSSWHQLSRLAALLDALTGVGCILFVVWLFFYLQMRLFIILSLRTTLCSYKYIRGCTWWMKVSNRLVDCLSLSLSKKKDGRLQEKEQSSESHYRIVSPTFQYKMSHQHVGKCIIINNKNFDEKTGEFSSPCHAMLTNQHWLSAPSKNCLIHCY